jgi:hypothetical protein
VCARLVFVITLAPRVFTVAPRLTTPQKNVITAEGYPQTRAKNLMSALSRRFGSNRG